MEEIEMKPERPYAKAARTFLILFVISTVLVLGVVLVTVQKSSSQVPDTTAFDIAVIGTLLTSITTFIGFISTTLLGWRKERRESRVAEMDRQRQQLELEKVKIELERMKLEQTKHKK
jgi:hypothetical protein